MSKSIIKNYWPSFLLSLVLVVGLVVCLKKVDCLAAEEVNAMITVVFGSATSCLLLSFIWLIQHKPLQHRPWPNQGLVLSHQDAIPSMNPRGRENLNETPPELTIGTISEVILERPPTYEDALANSKPLNSHYLGQSQYPNCECATSRMQSSSGRKKKRCNNCTRFQNKQHLTMAALRCSDDSIPPSSVSSGESQRKISYIQLDVNQLMLSTSPPKYWELHFNNYLTDAITTRNTLDKTQG